MSFLRKRSRSQCSFTRGHEEITVTRTQNHDCHRVSRADTFPSTRPSVDVDPSGFTVHDSCVLRNFPKHKSSHLRFLAWVSYTRKYTDEWITEVERRTCPLLWCRTVFDDQEEMIKHVWNCQHLSKGLYWCFHCQKPERVAKSQCKRCLGLPSRTDRMASVAKRIFSKLGAKSHHAVFPTPESELQRPPSKITENSETSYNSRSKGLSHSFHEVEIFNWNQQYPHELPNTFILREMPGDGIAASHELPDTYISEMQGTECPIELGIGSEGWADNFYASSLEEWDVSSTTGKAKNNFPKLARLDTSFTQLNSYITHGNQGEISPQNHSSHSWENPLSSTIISPLSASGGFDTNTLEISPTDTIASGATFFTDSGYSTATTTSAWSASATTFGNRNAWQVSKKGQKPSQHLDKISNEWLDDMAFSRLPELALMPVLPSVPQFPKEISLTSGSSSSERPVLSSAHWSNARTLVQYFSEILDAHIQHTKTSLKQLPSSSLVAELMTLSRTSMVSIGLEALTAALEGRKPTSIVQIFSLTHVAYAFAIAVDHDETNVQDQQWFHDSLSWAEELIFDRERQQYHQIARSVWQPLDIFGEDMQYVASPSSNKENRLLTACKHFLDVFESFDNSDAVINLPNGRFDFVQEMFQNRSKTQVIDAIIKNRSFEVFHGNVAMIETRLLEGKITTTRQLELELICAGKLSSKTSTSLGTYLSYVNHLFDSIYEEEMESMKPRLAHHIQDISHIKQLLPEEHCSDELEKDDCDHYDQNVYNQVDEEDLLDLSFDTRSEDIESCIKAFQSDADQTLGHIDIDFLNHMNSSSSPPVDQGPSMRVFEPSQQQSTTSYLQPTPQIPTSTLQLSFPPSTSSSSASDKYRCHCGYIPSGEERWKASNLRRHKRTQHPTELRVHRCGYPGCKSVFTRSDNLRSHRRDKGHFLGIEAEPFPEMGLGGMSSSERARGPKRRKGDA